MKFIMSTIIAGICLVACTGPTGVKEGSKTSDMPEWVRTDGNYDGKGIGAIGSAAFDETGTQIQRSEAKTAARAELSQIIEVRIQSSISTTNQRLKDTGLGAGREVSALQTQAIVSALADRVMKNSQPVKQWRDPTNRELYVWVVIDGDKLDESLMDEMANKIFKKKLNDAAEDHQKKLKIMREELRKELRKDIK
mgnify:CR=1 FL=1